MTDGTGRTTRRALLAGAAGLGAAIAGCSLPGDGTGAGGKGATTLTPAPVPTVADPVTVTAESGRDLTVAHWLRRADERAGFEAMAAPFEDEAGVDVRPPDGWSLSFTRNGMAERVSRGYPPGVWQIDPGARLAWPVRRDLLVPIDDAVWSDPDVRAGYPPTVAALAAHDGRFVAVPWQAERLNNLFYNPRVLDRAGVDPGSIEPGDLPAVAERIATRTDATPVVQSTGAPWQVGQLFEGLVVGHAGVETLRRLSVGRIDATVRSTVRESLGTVAALAEYLPADADEIDRATATARVVEGSAAMTVLRDGAVGGPAAETGFSAAEGATYGEDWAHRPLPGTGGVFQFTATSFVAPANNPTPELSRAWLRYVASPDAQWRFCTRAGTVPLRTDLDPRPLPPFPRSQYDDYRRASRRVPSLTHGLAAPPAGYQALLTALFQFTGDWDAERATRQVLGVLGGESETPSPRRRPP